MQMQRLPKRERSIDVGFINCCSTGDKKMTKFYNQLTANRDFNVYSDQYIRTCRGLIDVI